MSPAAILLFGFTCVALFIAFLFTQQKLQFCSKKFLFLFNFFLHIRQKSFLLFAAIISTMLLSCNQNNSVENKLPSNDSTVFYPVRDYFIDQIKRIDSISPRIEMFTNVNGQKDSAIISTQQFDKIAQSFLENDISDKSVKKYYRQSVFQDQTTESITFNYTTVNSSLPVQSLDILLDTTTQEVKRIFIAKIKTIKDSTIIEKLSWKTNSNFLINRITQSPPNKETTQQISVVWHDNN